jgi:predicted acyl esterase
MHLTFPFSAIPQECKIINNIPENERASLNLHLGSVGALRASYRAFDPVRSIHEQFPFHPQDKEEEITPGEVVKPEIGIWSMDVDFDAGESISVQVSGGKSSSSALAQPSLTKVPTFPCVAEYSASSTPRPWYEKNRGLHRINLGPETPSRSILSFVPL